MHEETINEAVKEMLADEAWRYGGTISGEVGSKTKHKSSIVERRLREAYRGMRGKVPCEKYLDRRYVPNPNGRGAPVVQYKLLETITI